MTRCAAPERAHSHSGTRLSGATGSSPLRTSFLWRAFLALTTTPITNATGTAAKAAYFTFVASGKAMFLVLLGHKMWQINNIDAIDLNAYSIE